MNDLFDSVNTIDFIVAVIFIVLLWLYDFFVLRKYNLTTTNGQTNDQTNALGKTGGSSEKGFQLEEIKLTPEEIKKKEMAELNPNVPLAKQPVSFDEYEDKATYYKKLPNFNKEIRNVVIDGANFIHYIKPKTHYDHLEYIEKSIKILRKKLPGKNIYFIVKDDGPAEKQLDKTRLQKLAKNPLVHILVSQGDTKARDDYLAILMTELLGEKTILLTRDRYRDIQNISGSHTNDYKIFSKNEKKIQKLLKSTEDTTVGKWSFMKRNLGYTSNPEIEEGFWERRPYKNSEASDRSFVFHI